MIDEESGWRSGNLASGQTTLAADSGQVLAPVAGLGSHHQPAVGQVRFVLAAQGNLALLHSHYHFRLVGGLVVVGSAGVDTSV